jgi:hypothetical protein
MWRATSFESDASHAGMYAHDSTSSVTNAEWITIHLLSDVQVMMPSIQAAILSSRLHQPRTAACDIGHFKRERSEISYLPGHAGGFGLPARAIVRSCVAKRYARLPLRYGEMRGGLAAGYDPGFRFAHPGYGARASLLGSACSLRGTVSSRSSPHPSCRCAARSTEPL